MCSWKVMMRSNWKPNKKLKSADVHPRGQTYSNFRTKLDFVRITADRSAIYVLVFVCLQTYPETYTVACMVYAHCRHIYLRSNGKVNNLDR